MNFMFILNDILAKNKSIVFITKTHYLCYRVSLETSAPEGRFDCAMTINKNKCYFFFVCTGT